MLITCPPHLSTGSFYKLAHMSLEIFRGSKLWPVFSHTSAASKEQSTIFPTLGQVQIVPGALLPYIGQSDRKLPQTKDVQEIVAAASKHRPPFLSMRPCSVCPASLKDNSDPSFEGRVGAMAVVLSSYPDANIYIHNMTTNVAIVTGLSTAAKVHFLYPKCLS